MSIERLFSETIHLNYPKYFANFPPNNPVRIGDFGYLKNSSFDFVGNVEEVFKIKSGKIRKGKHADVEFKSRSGISVKTSAKGQIDTSGLVNNKSLVTVEFKKANSVFFVATGCQIKMIEDKVSFSNHIVDLYKNDLWEGSFVIITSIIEAKSLNLLISVADNASIIFEANSKVPNVNVFDASVTCGVVNEDGISNKFLAEKNTCPLIGLSKISKRNIFGKPDSLRTKFLVGGELQNEEVELQKLKNTAKKSGQPINEMLQLLPLDDSTK